MAVHRRPIEINAKGKRIVNRKFNPNYRDEMSGKEMDRFLETESIKVTASARMGCEFYWYLKLEPFLEIEREGQVQQVVGKRDLAGLRSKYAFIRQLPDGSEEIYLVPTPDLQDILLERFKEKIGGNNFRRFADPSSTYVTLHPENLQEYIIP